MSREHKFQVWDGERMHLPDESNFCIASDGRLFEVIHKEYSGNPHHGWDLRERPDCEVLKPTGYCDRKGNKVWSGSILAFPDDDEVNMVVRWSPVRCGFAAFDPSLGDDQSGYNLGMQIGERGGAVVIGNVFENPELIESEAPA